MATTEEIQAEAARLIQEAEGIGHLISGVEDDRRDEWLNDYHIAAQALARIADDPYNE